MSPSRPQPPASARTAVRLIWGGAVLSVLGILLQVMQIDEIRRQAEASLMYDVDGTVDVIVTWAVAFGLVGTGLWIWMAVMNGLGRNWARIVATVFGGLNIAGSMLALIVSGSGVGYGATIDGEPVNAVAQALFAGCSVALAITIIVLMWRASSSQWYDAVGRARQAARAQAQAQPVPVQMLPPNQF